MLRPERPLASSSSMAAVTICSRLSEGWPRRDLGGRTQTEVVIGSVFRGIRRPSYRGRSSQRTSTRTLFHSGGTVYEKTRTACERRLMSTPSSTSAPEPAPGAEGTSAPNPRRWVILGVLCLSLLVIVIDNTVLNVAIPSLIRDLHASNADIQWVLDAYMVVFAGLLLTAGGLSDRYGRRNGLVLGLVLFGGASIPAAFSGSPGQLIASRALMGAGAAFLMPGTLSILTTVFDDEERKKALAIWSSVLMVGAVAGPLVGGLLLRDFWWGSVFLLNIPIAVLGVIAALLIIPESRGPAVRPDVVGAVLSTAGMTALVWGVIETARDGWSSGRTIGGFAVAVVMITAFGVWERRCAEPMLPMG